VTSVDTAKPGDTVTITGTVRVNKNVGAGYSYPVLIEDAKVLR
jgi:DNA replicative helicase MCM subunit Mcm2 (Cdc46/Mcm family)